MWDTPELPDIRSIFWYVKLGVSPWTACGLHDTHKTCLIPGVTEIIYLCPFSCTYAPTDLFIFLVMGLISVILGANVQDSLGGNTCPLVQ